MNKHEIFLSAIHEKKVIKIQANTEEKGIIERQCIAFDFGPSSRDKAKINKYQVRTLDSPTGSHNLAIKPEDLLAIEILDIPLDLPKIITWPPPYKWHIPRDWGQYS